MRDYVCFWKGKRCEVQALTSYGARQKAQAIFQKQAGRRHVSGPDVSVTLAEKACEDCGTRPAPNGESLCSECQHAQHVAEAGDADPGHGDIHKATCRGEGCSAPVQEPGDVCGFKCEDSRDGGKQ